MAVQLSDAARLMAAERDVARRGFSLSRGRGTGIFPERHHHQGLELLWIAQGVGQIYVDEHSYNFGAGDAILLDGNEEHSLRPYSGSFVRALLYFSADVVNRPLLTELRTLRAVAEYGVAHARPPAPVQARIDGWVDAMLQELQQDRPAGDAAVAAYLQLILVELERHVSERGHQGAHAAALLRRPGAAIFEVAADVGYSSAFAFSRAYKRYFGVPPSQARIPGS